MEDIVWNRRVDRLITKSSLKWRRRFNYIKNLFV